MLDVTVNFIMHGSILCVQNILINIKLLVDLIILIQHENKQFPYEKKQNNNLCTHFQFTRT